LGYLVATVEYGLKHPELGQEFRTYLESLQGMLAQVKSES